jgi:hypothetical protein
MVAPSTSVVTPVPSPTAMPQLKMSCHGLVISVLAATLTARTASASMTVRRMPTRCISAAANGPISPKRAILIEMASEMVVALQPKASWSGTSSTLGVARIPTPASSVTKMTAATIQA